MNSIKENSLQKNLCVVVITVFFLPAVVVADSVIIENNVSASASTGGNSARNGTVTEGNTKATAEVKSTINGRTIEKKKVDQGESAQAHVEINSQNTLSNHAVDIQGSASLSELSSGSKSKSSTTVTVEEQPEESEQNFLSMILMRAVAYVSYIFKI